MTDFHLEGVATEFNKCFAHDGKLLYLKAGCLGNSIDGGAPLLYDHDWSKRFPGAVELHAGNDYLVFRYDIKMSDNSPLCADYTAISEDNDSYLPVSIGLTVEQSNSLTIDGTDIEVVTKARLTEISVLSKDSPAVPSTYARITSFDSNGSLIEDYKAGLFRLYCKYIHLHRKALALETGRIKYGHTSSPYEKAADGFRRALRKCSA